LFFGKLPGIAKEVDTMSNNEDIGIKDKIRQRLLSANSEEDLKRIRQELRDEGFKQGSIDAVGHELRKAGHLRFNETKASSTKSMLKDLVPTMQSFIEDVHVPRPVDGADGYWDGYEMGARRARQDLIFSLLAMRELSSQSTSQVVSLAKELRGQQNSAEIAQMAAQQTLQGFLPEVLDLVRQQGIAQSPNPMMSLMMTLMQPTFQQAAQHLAKFFGATQMLGQLGQQPQEQQAEQPPVEQQAQAEQPQAQPQAQQPAGSSPNIKQRSIKEWEDK
jgi:hypothetical protein